MVQQLSSDAISVKKDRLIYHLSPQSEGGYTIVVPSYPSCISQGETIDESLEAIEDALFGCLSVDMEDGLKIPSELKSWYQQKKHREAKDPSSQRTYQSA